MKQLLPSVLLLLLAGAALFGQAEQKKVASQPEEIESLYKEADALYKQGKYREAKAKMLQSYAAFGLLKDQDEEIRVRYLRLLCLISWQLQELSLIHI